MRPIKTENKCKRAGAHVRTCDYFFLGCLQGWNVCSFASMHKHRERRNKDSIKKIKLRGKDHASALKMQKNLAAYLPHPGSTFPANPIPACIPAPRSAPSSLPHCGGNPPPRHLRCQKGRGIPQAPPPTRAPSLNTVAAAKI